MYRGKWNKYQSDLCTTLYLTKKMLLIVNYKFVYRFHLYLFYLLLKKDVFNRVSLEGGLMHSGPPSPALPDASLIWNRYFFNFADQIIRVNSNSLVQINFSRKSLNFRFQKQQLCGRSLGKVQLQTLYSDTRHSTGYNGKRFRIQLDNGPVRF
jgi:hypothetical protein